VEHEEITGNLYHVEYRVDGGEPITIATTRPETMLGDTGVAVHPDDERYRDLVGKTARLPILDRALPIVADEAVDRAFGTGALKVTPGHDPVDFEIGRRHGLPALEMMDEAGRVTEVGGKFAGMDRFAARKAIVKELEALGLLKKTEPHRRAVGHCYRCRTVVEPILSTQWFVRMKPLAEPALAAVRDGRIAFEPARWTKVYNHWMENIHDWCVSRQLWWGHRIPAWYCEGDDHCTIACKEPIVARSAPAACPHCGSARLRQDEDVLDTWFSSWLWPFSTLGWPDKTKDLEYFFPGTILVSAHEILFFWIARMIMSSLAFMGEVPFARVLIHGIVRDEKGRKMSKTLGNSPDPIDLMERVGTDALRFSIVYTTPSGQDVLYSEKSTEMGKHLANKIWNAARLILARIAEGDGGDGARAGGSSGAWPPPAGALRLEDRWILSRTRATIETVTREFEALHPNEAMSALYDFFWHDLCDWYLEHAKLRRDGKDAELVTTILVRVFRTTLSLFHPVMPFVTEEVASHFPGGGRMLAAGPWPRPEDFSADPEAEERFAHARRLTTWIRTRRSEAQISPALRVPAVHFKPLNEMVTTSVADCLTTITQFAKVQTIDLAYSGAPLPNSFSDFLPGSGTVAMPLEGLVDIPKERERLAKEADSLNSQLLTLRKKLADKSFIERAPEEVVQRERNKESQFAQRLATLQRNLETFGD
jgi:valyl-tRNA synthetase